MRECENSEFGEIVNENKGAAGPKLHYVFISQYPTMFSLLTIYHLIIISLRKQIKFKTLCAFIT